MKIDNAFAISLKEACVLAGVQKDTLYAAINSGELPSLKIGKRRLFRPETIRAWITRKEHETHEAMGFDSPIDGR